METLPSNHQWLSFKQIKELKRQISELDNNIQNKAWREKGLKLIGQSKSGREITRKQMATPEAGGPNCSVPKLLAGKQVCAEEMRSQEMLLLPVNSTGGNSSQ